MFFGMIPEPFVKLDPFFLDCECETENTMSASNVCTKDLAGLCPCQDGFWGRQCDKGMNFTMLTYIVIHY